MPLSLEASPTVACEADRSMLVGEGGARRLHERKKKRIVCSCARFLGNVALVKSNSNERCRCVV